MGMGGFARLWLDVDLFSASLTKAQRSRADQTHNGRQYAAKSRRNASSALWATLKTLWIVHTTSA